MLRRLFTSRVTAVNSITFGAAPASPADAPPGGQYPQYLPPFLRGNNPMRTATTTSSAPVAASTETASMLASIASHGAETVHRILAQRGDGSWARTGAGSLRHPAHVTIEFTGYGARLSFHCPYGISHGQQGLGLVELPHDVSHEVIAHIAASLVAYAPYAR